MTMFPFASLMRAETPTLTLGCCVAIIPKYAGIIPNPSLLAL